MTGGPAFASRTWLVASGGRLYDNWYKALGTTPPSETHPTWPVSDASMTGPETWRCSSCHGWDYRGAIEQKSPGGDKAIQVANLRNADKLSIEDIMARLGDQTHGYSDHVLPTHAKYRLALFVTSGQHDINAYIAPNGLARADTDNGKPIFQDMCASCHGFNGKLSRAAGLHSVSAVKLIQRFEIETKSQNEFWHLTTILWDYVNSPPTKAGGFPLRLQAGSVRYSADWRPQFRLH